jgi:hypothetical protein
MTHFKQHLLTQFLNVLTSRSDEERSPLSTLLASLPQQIPLFSQEEMDNTELLEGRRDQLEQLSAWADPTTWQVVKSEQEEQADKDVFFFVPQATEKILTRKQEEQRDAAAMEIVRHIWVLKSWGLQLRETGEVGSAFTLEEAIEQIEKSNELTQIVQEERLTIDLREASWPGCSSIIWIG